MGFVTLEQIDKATAYRYAPAFYLLWSVSDDQARDELHTRLQNSSLSLNQASILVDHALAIQANRNTPWDPIYGDIIEDAYDAGVMSSAQIESYFNQMLTLR